MRNQTRGFATLLVLLVLLAIVLVGGGFYVFKNNGVVTSEVELTATSSAATTTEQATQQKEFQTTPSLSGTNMVSGINGFSAPIPTGWKLRIPQMIGGGVLDGAEGVTYLVHQDKDRIDEPFIGLQSAETGTNSKLGGPFDGTQVGFDTLRSSPEKSLDASAGNYNEGYQWHGKKNITVDGYPAVETGNRDLGSGSGLKFGLSVWVRKGSINYYLTVWGSETEADSVVPVFDSFIERVTFN